MGKAFQRWCESVETDDDALNDNLNEICEEATNAIDACDVAKLRIKRERVVMQLAGHNSVGTRELYLHDEEHWGHTESESSR